MTDWDSLRRAVFRIIGQTTDRLTASAAGFADRIIARLRSRGWRLDEEAEGYIYELANEVHAILTEALQNAIAGAAAGQGLDFIERQLEEAFHRRLGDDLNLSDRLWRWQDQTRRGVLDSLAESLALRRSVNGVIFDMQRTIERETGARFDIVSDRKPVWIKKLEQAGRRVIRNPQGKQAWDKAVQAASDYIDRLKDTGTRQQSLAMLKKIEKAVASGQESLIAEAIRWRIYDKQLYNLKRIARTEISTAWHRATIAATRDDDLIIGYRWRLSASHPDPDICDWFAGIELGLGKGVWPKDRVPEGKAHPHCFPGNTCVLAPGSISAATQSFYQGRVVEIVTRDSGRLTCTPNHPILTDKGWVPAQFLHKGQKVFKASTGQSCPLGVDNDHMPTTIEQVFEALLESGAVTSVTMPVAAENFHGDGRFMNGNVHIVNVDRLLWRNRYAGLMQHVRKHFFMNGNVGRIFFFGPGVPDLLLDAFAFAANGVMRLFRDALTKFRRCLGHIELLAFVQAANLNVVFPETADNDGPRYAKSGSQRFNRLARLISDDDLIDLKFDAPTHIDAMFLESSIHHSVRNANAGGDFFQGLAISIALDEIVEIRDRDFSGFVYDLQIEPHHWYLANGIVVHNCLCSLTPVTRPGREPGAANAGELMQRLPEAARRQIAPRWAVDLNNLGVDWQQLTDPATGWFARKKDIAAKVGEDRLQAMRALGRALDVPEWGRPRIGRGRMKRKTMDVLAQHRSDPVVTKALRQAERDGRVDGLVLHYARRRYLDGVPLSGPEDLDRRFERLLQGNGHRIYRQILGGGTRFAIYSEESGWVAVVDASGRRVTAFLIDPDSNPDDLGEPLWLIGELKAF